MTKLYVFMAFLVLFSCGCTTQEETTTTQPLLLAGDGDTVSVNYVGRLTDGSVFDTSYEEVAREAEIYSLLRTYEPLTFKIGEDAVIEGFENAVMNMSVGEEKTVRVTPRNAYGSWDPELVLSANRTQAFPRTVNLSLEDFVSEFGKDPVVGETYGANGSWNQTVVFFDEEVVTVRFDPGANQTAQTNFGPASVGFDEEHIFIRANPENNTWIQTDSGVAKIVDVSEDEIKIDLNHRLAGETLIFDIRVEEIEPGS